jgi:hypothetical protein
MIADKFVENKFFSKVQPCFATQVITHHCSANRASFYIPLPKPMEPEFFRTSYHRRFFPQSERFFSAIQRSYNPFPSAIWKFLQLFTKTICRTLASAWSNTRPSNPSGTPYLSTASAIAGSEEWKLSSSTMSSRLPDDRSGVALKLLPLRCVAGN